MGQSPIPQYYNPATDTFEAIQGDGGAQNVRVEDGANEALGATTDAKVVDPDVNATEIALLKGQLDRQNEALTTLTDILAKLNATLTTNTTVTNFPATQTVSGTVTANVGTTNGLALDATLMSGNAKTQVTTLPSLPAGTNVIGKVEVADGGDSAMGAKTDSAATTDTGTFSLIALTKRLLSQFATWLLTVGTPGSAAPSRVTMLGATDGTNAQALKVDAQKNLLVGLRSSSGLEPAMTDGGNDGKAQGVNGVVGIGYTMAYNGASWDRWRNNTEGTLLASAARTATPPSSTMTNYNHRGLDLQFRVTAVTGSPSLTVSVQTQDADGNWVSIASFTAVTAVGVYSYQIYPGAQSSASYTSVRGTALPRTWRVLVTHGTADSVTYSLKYALIV
jgi:hypothetical protein